MKKTKHTTIPIMIRLNHLNIILFLTLNMSLCLIVHAGLIMHRPTIYDDDLLAFVEPTGLLNNDYQDSNRNDRHRSLFYENIYSPSYDDNIIRQMINRQKTAKRSKLNLHTNLNLPRYLRNID